MTNVPKGEYTPIDLASNFTTHFFQGQPSRQRLSGCMVALNLDLAELFADIQAGRITLIGAVK